jgi:4a-hydroxytetrahydrobiopterin dehydratase
MPTETMEPITFREFLETEGLEDWRATSDGALAFYRIASFSEGVEFLQAISETIKADGRKPDVDIRDGGVTIRLITVTDTHYGLMRADVDLARIISGVAREQGLTADPSAIQSILIVPGAQNIAEVVPFWQAILGYQRRPDSPDEDLVDPHGRGPAFWFEQMEQPRSHEGGAIHLGIWVPYEQAESRVQAALAAGGHMVRDDYAPAWWTLADAAGNEADIATPKQRD